VERCTRGRAEPSNVPCIGWNLRLYKRDANHE
jgi:hypothetical protein